MLDYSSQVCKNLLLQIVFGALLILMKLWGKSYPIMSVGSTASWNCKLLRHKPVYKTFGHLRCYKNNNAFSFMQFSAKNQSIPLLCPPSSTQLLQKFCSLRVIYIHLMQNFNRNHFYGLLINPWKQGFIMETVTDP